jgi:hypothetical protein
MSPAKPVLVPLHTLLGQLLTALPRVLMVSWHMEKRE